LLLLLTARVNAGGHRMLELLAMCERKCFGSSACVVVEGESLACSGANVWSSESGGLRAACVAVANEECLAQVEGTIRAVSIAGTHTDDLVLDEGTVRHWRNAQLVYVARALPGEADSADGCDPGCGNRSVENMDAPQLVQQLPAFSELSTLYGIHS
jgi:hypothetical protein